MIGSNSFALKTQYHWKKDTHWPFCSPERKRFTLTLIAIKLYWFPNIKWFPNINDFLIYNAIHNGETCLLVIHFKSNISSKSLKL